MLGKTEEEVKKDKKESEKQEKELRKLQSAYKDIFEGTAGKLVLKDLKNLCHVNRTTYVSNSDDTVFNEGQRSVFLHIITMANIDVDKLKEVRNVE
jgi:hypothetical protein